jgi:nitrate reductase gamma subunit
MVGLGVERVEYAPVPFFFTDTPIYTQLGIVAFLRHGLVLTIGVLASLPAFVGTAPLLSERIAALGVPIAGIQIGSVLLALLLAVATTRAAVTVAVQRFREYQLE